MEAGERGVRSEASPKVAFVFPGQGVQWAGMGRSFYGSEPAVREVLERCDAVFGEELGERLLPVMFGDTGEEDDLDAAWRAQPALYALGCGLTAFWKEAGLRPAAVLGLSAGELAAAHAAGMVGLEEGMRFAVRLGRLQASLAAGGGMGAVFLTEEETARRIPELDGGDDGTGLTVAAYNGAHQLLSGPRELLAAVLSRLDGEGVRTALLPIREAAHCALMDPILDGVEAAADAMEPGRGLAAFVSSRTGELIEGPGFDGRYWRAHVRRPLRFARAVGTLAELGVRVLVDLGPRGRTALTASGAWPAAERGPLLVPTLTGPSGAGEGAAAALRRARESGAPVSFGPEEFEAAGEHEASAPDDLEAFLVREVQELARFSAPPAADTGFFELGMGSLEVAELGNRLNRALGGSVEISPADVFSHPDIARLAAHAAAQRRESPGRPVARPGTAGKRVRSGEPVAVVGMSCRFPGGGGVEDFWKRLRAGEDLVMRDRPGGPLPGVAGGEAEMWGAYLPEVDRFDAEFFRIAPVEAELMDPQQRWLLEVSWEALEDAGIAPGRLKGSRTGVYAGMVASDYGGLVAHTAPGLYRSTGTSFSAAIGRVAFALGLEGPAVTVDTACSASLVALHQAVVALERGEVELALAGGVNAILTPGLTETYGAAGMLSPDGRCRTFDAGANGFVRGEGCGMLALMRLSAARSGGHRVLGLVLGSAVNQDGASAGLTAPNGRAQERLIGEALWRAGVLPGEVDYLEAHGTGTPLGDPIELGAAASAYGEGRESGRPLLVGSVKPNVGHLEAAAGVAGVIKVLLSMREGSIPAQLHYAEPNPRLDWGSLPVSVVTEEVGWEAGERPRRAGVSSFGYSGTNAHVVLEAYDGPPPSVVGAPASERRPPAGIADRREAKRTPAASADAVPPAVDETQVSDRRHRVLPLSGRSPAALEELAGRYREWLGESGRDGASLSDAAWTAGVGRDHFRSRAGLVFTDAAELREGLDAVAEGRIAGGPAGSKIGFLYTGQGSQWAGMGRELYEREPAFRAVLDCCEAAFREERGEPLLPVMFGEAEGLDRTEWTQPALYALESGLTALWGSVGVRPDAVFGHSAGEVAAAAAAGVFDLEAGLRFAARRGALMGSLPEGGAMAAVFAPAEEIRAALSGPVSLAAENGVHSVVSGPEDAMAPLLAAFAERDIRVERLAVSHAFHSAQLDPVLDELKGSVGEVSAPATPLVSGLSGAVLEGVPDGAWWRRQAREPVRFAAAMETFAELGAGVLVEIGPAAVLGPMAALAWPGGAGPKAVASLRKGGTGDFAAAVAAVYEAGADVSFGGLFAGERRRRVPLPTYPFQRERYWVEPPGRRRSDAGHPLLGTRFDLRRGETAFETELGAEDPAWLADHRVFGEVVSPAALYAAQAFAALGELGRGPSGSLVEVQFHRPLVLAERGRSVQVLVDPEGRFEVASREAGAGWELHAEGGVGPGGTGEPAVAIAELREGLSPLPAAEVYARLAARGIVHGPAFRVLGEVWAGPETALAEVALPEGSGLSGTAAQAVLLDGAFQALYATPGLGDGEGAWLPFGWERLWLLGPLPKRLWCRVQVERGSGETRSAELAFHTPAGAALGGVRGFTLKRGGREAVAGSRVEDLLYEVSWREASPVGAPEAERAAGLFVLADGDALGEELAEELRRRRQTVVRGPAAGDREAWRSLFASLPAEVPLRGVAHLPGAWEEAPEPPAGELRDELKVLGSGALAVVQGLTDAGVRPSSGVWFVTRGGQLVGGERPEALSGRAPCGAALWGFASAVGLEHGELRPRLVDLDPDAPVSADVLADELLLPDREDRVAWRGGKRRAARLTRSGRRPEAPETGPLRPDRSYLVTGGLGGLGLEVAGWLVEAGVGAVVLSGRRTPGKAAEAVITELRERGVEVRAEIADVTDARALAAMLERVAAELPPLGGVIHSAGALSDAALPNQDWASFERVLGPKALGAWNLHRATLDLDLDLFVLFSSVAGVLGNAGQANHCAANAFLDQLARWRRAQGLAGQSIAWGAWSGTGEAEEQRGRIGSRLAALGFGWLTPKQGLAALSRLVRENTEAAAVAAVDWERLGRDGRRLPPLLDELRAERGPAGPAADGDGSVPDGRWVARLREAGTAKREELLRAFLQEEVRSVLRLRSPAPPDVGFFDLGMDSLMALDLRRRLDRTLAGVLPGPEGGELAVPNTVVFDHPDITRLARHLVARLESPDARPAPTRRLSTPRGEERIAVVGMACRFPGGPDPASFWRSLAAGADAVTRGRPEPLPVDPGAAESPAWGAYLPGLDRFDADFFRIAPMEAELMDPQQRLLLEVGWEALEDAGLDPGGLRGSRTGVYAGIMYNEYEQLLPAGGAGEVHDLYRATGNRFSASIGRVSFVLGLEGPAIAVDTACSSSLVAIHQAAAGLQRGEADLALAGGVNAILIGQGTDLPTTAGMLARDGRCKTFDAAADGYVRGEGCGMLVLKRLSDAERDGDRIRGLILGSAVNQDGASAGFTVPNGPAQERVIGEALERAGVEPAEVDYLEAHGTGTELGDPIEVRAAAAAYGAGRAADRPLLLGSVKTNVGHLESAAGVAGVVKVLLAMRHGVLPPHLHFERPNPRLDWERLPVRVVSEARPWPEGLDRPVRAGVSSFGFSGTNAHLILERWEEPAPVVVGAPASGRHRRPKGGETQLPNRPYRLLPLSAKTGNALRDLAERYRGWLAEEERDGAALSDAAWTAGVGRSHFGHRAGVVFRDAAELEKGLRSVERDGGAEAAPGKTAFLFTGQGSQWAGMGRDLYEREPAFREVLDRCAAVFREEGKGSLLAVMFGEGDGLDRTSFTQPALYALQSGLTTLWGSVGVRPDAVFGHSVGELSAAYAAGAFGLEEGMLFAVRRGALMGSLPAGGGMAAVFAPEEAVRAELEKTNARVRGVGLSLAAENGTHSVVSGPLRLVRSFTQRLEERGVRTERLQTSHAFHSGLMEPALEALGAAAPTAGELAVPLVSDVTGRVLETGELEAGYWVRQARSPVRFGAAVETFAELGVGVVVEVGPRPVLGPLAALVWPESEGAAPAVVSSLTEGMDGGFARAVGGAYEAGLPVSFAGLFAGERRNRVALPTYPFQRERHWAPVPRRRLAAPAGENGLRPAAFLRIPPPIRDFEEFLEAEQSDGARLTGLTAGLDELARSCARAALAKLRGSGAPVEGTGVETLGRKLGVVVEHRQLFQRVLGIAADGPPAGHPEELFGRLVEAHPEGTVELGLLRRCGTALPEVLRGRVEGLELLFCGAPNAADLYRKAPGYRALNALAGEAVASVVSPLPEDRRLRVLEVGAGTGGTTAALLPALPEGRTDYVYTDISAGFFGEAEECFGGGEAGMEYRVLDIEQDPEEQGFAAHRHDLVVAANVLHATRDLGESLRNCRRLLAPSGVLVLVEGVEARAWLDLTFGMLPGWWRFADGYREEYPLVEPGVWRQALETTGYGEIALTETGLGQAVLLARGPSQLEPEELAPRGREGGAGDADLPSRLREAPAAEREAMLLALVREETRAVLRRAAPPAAEAGFFELGMDSLMAVELRNRLHRALSEGDRAAALPATLVLNHPSPAKLAHHLAGRFDASAGVHPAPARRLAIRRSEERIAVVGMGCRFPEGADPASFWRALAVGANAVTKGRPEPLPVDPETAAALAWGAYLPGLDRFDAEFFRIAPVEAELMDPQQRLLLEVSWEALEDSGLAPGGLEGSRTGVYAGITTSDYRDLLGLDGRDGTEGLYAATGMSFSTAIGRVAFALGLQGPAIAVDTACSSSLVAIHQAVAALQRGEADLALAGGVNAILTATVTRLFESGGMLSPDGRCKTFDAAADGYVRGEGCGMVVLKRLSDAERDGDRIRGVILGSALNQDGASAGLTVPNEPAQEQVIGEALERAGVSPAEVDYLEAHGTGTELGDPIEVAAAAAAYGEGRAADRPLLLGSVKTNVGHLESAAGIASVIKVLLAMQEGVIPKHLHFERPNPRLDWERLPVRVVSEATPWPEDLDRPIRAGVSSFGFSGTNAHLILEAYDRAPPSVVGAPASGRHRRPKGGETHIADRPHRVLPLSGKTSAALSELAGRYRAWLEEEERDGTALSDAAWTAGTGRSHFGRRAALSFRDAAELKEGLRSVERDGGAAATPGKTAFLFTGQGSQWAGMGREFYEREPLFRDVLDRCAAVFAEEGDGSLLPVLFGEEGDLDRTEWTQPALYALQSGLTALWASVGVRPDAVFGHSVGELSAASAAGACGLEEGMRFAVRRGALMGSLPAGGGMAAVFAPEEAVRAELERTNARVRRVGLSLAAENGAHCVVSGPLRLLRSLERRLGECGVRTERLTTSHAFHSGLMEPVLPALAEAAPAVGELAVPLVSGVTGRVLETGEALEAGYWVRQARSPVRFGAVVGTLSELGIGVLVEVGPRPVLGPLAALAWPEAGDGAPTVLATLTEGADGAFARAVGGAYEAGLPVSFAGLFTGERRRRAALPTYPFQRERHWASALRRRRTAPAHPLLGERRELPSGEVSFEIETTDLDWLGDHRVFGRAVAPAAFYGAAAVAAAAIAEPQPRTRSVETLRIERPLVLAGDGSGEADGRTVQVVLGSPGSGAGRSFEVHSRAEGDTAWTLHAAGGIRSEALPGAAGLSAAARERLEADLAPDDPAALYRRLAAIGLWFGPRFQGLRRLWSADDQAFGEIVLPDEVDPAGLEAHPVLLDACFHVAAGAALADGGETAWMPIGWEELWLAGPLPERILCLARLARSAGESGETLKVVFELYAPDGEALAGIRGFTLAPVKRAAFRSAAEGVQELLYEVEWWEADEPGLSPADFLTDPQVVASGAPDAGELLRTEGLDAAGTRALADDLEELSHHYARTALAELGLDRSAARTPPERLRRELRVVEQHRLLFERLLRMVEDPGAPEPAGAPNEPSGRGPDGATELELLRRCGSALSEVLRGRADGLELLFSGAPSAADLYREAPRYRALNRLAADAAGALAAGLPEGRRLRVLEVGAGTGATTAAVLPALPEDRTDYTWTDVSAGFFRDAEERFGGSGARMEYRALDIERDPEEQGFAAHRHDLVVAANVLHATRDLGESLLHCRRLLAPSGVLVLVEAVEAQAWLDLTFGLVEGWWRFADRYRADHALISPPEWRRAIADSGYGEVAVLGDRSGTGLGAAVILARGPAEVRPDPGVWVVWPGGEEPGLGAQLARELEGRGQTVVSPAAGPAEDPARREWWREVFAELPEDVPLRGVAHLGALCGRGELKEDVERALSGALALTQGLRDAGAAPAAGMWFVTRGGQVLDGERDGHLSGSALWGFGRTADRELADLPVRLLDLEPGAEAPVGRLAEELLFPDRETEIVYRGGVRRTPRLVRLPAGTGTPGDGAWRFAPDPGGALDRLPVERLAGGAPGPGEVRVAVEAAGLNFHDVLVAMGVVDPGAALGGELCGRVLETGPGVQGIGVGDRVLGFAAGTFGPEVVTRAEVLAPAPPGLSAAALATVPTAFVTAALAFEAAEPRAGDAVLVHAGTGGVGQAAIQWARAAGLTVYATASTGKREALGALGVAGGFDSRSPDFGAGVLAATGRAGVRMVLNSLTGAGFVEAGLSCLAEGGSFVELGKRGIWSAEEMAAARPDVAYRPLAVDRLLVEDPSRLGRVLGEVVGRVSRGELEPLPHRRWPLSELGTALGVMREARHVGKVVVAPSALATGRLRGDRSYLVTGGLGGVGLRVAAWLFERGAGGIVLNGRRVPEGVAAEAVARLRSEGAALRVVLADVAEEVSVNRMLGEIGASGLPPLGGVIHSVGVLSDRALLNQDWGSFERVLWPKVLGAWNLHRATLGLDLDLFVLFSAFGGLLGNPGQANHAAANAFLDQLALRRRSAGLAGQAIQWGAWSGVGEAEEQRDRIARARTASGEGWLTPEQGLAALTRLVSRDVATAGVAPVDWSVLFSGERQPPERFTALIADRHDPGPEAPEDLAFRLRGASGPEREALLLDFVREQARSVLRLRSLPPAGTRLFELGMDSLMAIELRHRLQRGLSGAVPGGALPDTLVFDYPDADQLARYLSGRFAPPAPEAPAENARGAADLSVDDLAAMLFEAEGSDA